MNLYFLDFDYLCILYPLHITYIFYISCINHIVCCIAWKKHASIHNQSGLKLPKYHYDNEHIQYIVVYAHVQFLELQSNTMLDLH